MRFKGQFKLSIVFALPHGQYTLRNLLSPFRIYDLMDYWLNHNNVLNVDFALFSTFENAFADTNKWTSCNFSAVILRFNVIVGPKKRSMLTLSGIALRAISIEVIIVHVSLCL